jgi:diguanylate cyclase (GGDEF)-like protein
VTAVSHRRRGPRPGAEHYAVAVALTGAAAFAVLLAVEGVGALAHVTVATSVLVLGAIAGEVLPIQVPRRDHEGVLSTSGPFVLALLIAHGPAEAVAAQVLATLVADGVQRRPPLKTAFNAGQSVLTVLAAAGVLSLLSGLPQAGGTFAPHDLVAIAASALAYTLVNNTLVAVVIALSTSSSVLDHLRYDFAFQTGVNAVLLWLAPVVLLVVQFSPALLPALLLPVAAVYQGSRQVVEIEHQALHDPLTGLPNRRLLRDRCVRALDGARASGRQVALLVMDLDGFKEVNDALGHASGDRLLTRVAERLADALGEGETIARLGGDEFAVLLPEVASPEAALGRADGLLAALAVPFDLMGLRLDVAGSVGVAVHPEHGHDVDTLLRRADVAMYAAKRAATARELYEPARDDSSAARLTLMADLRRALATDELELHYHPKVDLSTGAVLGVEALVRWRHPLRGMVPPLDFVPSAEQTGLIAPLSERVLELALEQCAVWWADGLRLHVAVNVSARNLLDGDLPALVSRLLTRAGLPPAALELEITESAVMADPVRAEAVLVALAGLGVGLSVDDFGTGYSSLAYLSRLPVDEMKIDREFVSRMDDGERDWIIVEASIALARRLGLRVVAEGVETEAMRRRLAHAGCDLAQGYLFTQPLPAAELSAWLAARGDGSGRVTEALSEAVQGVLPDC